MKKGYNKCKDNNQAFFDYKKGMLFAKNAGEGQFERDIQRRKLI